MRTGWTDRGELLGDQYRDASNLDARIRLYELFSTNRQGWHRWLFEQLDLAPDARLLELGSGSAALWAKNGDRIPPGWDITLSDLSPGMVAQARDNLREIPHPWTFAQIDAEDIPYQDAHFDAVLANHMLYHVPHRDRALAEIRRVLRPGGRLFASTLGARHLMELRAELTRLDRTSAFGAELAFDLETGGDFLVQSFEHVSLKRYKDALHVTDVAPLIDYVASGRSRPIVSGPLRQHFVAWAEGQIAAHGAVHISTDSGVFIAL